MWMFELNTFGIIYLCAAAGLAALLLIALFVFAAKKKAASAGTVWFRVADTLLLIVCAVMCFGCALANVKIFGLSVEPDAGALKVLSGSGVLFNIPFAGGLADVWTTYIGMGLTGLVTLLALTDLILACARRRKRKAVDLVGMVDEIPDSDLIEAEQLEYEEEKSRRFIDDDPLSTKYRYEKEVYYGIPGEEDDDTDVITMEDLRTDEPVVHDFEYGVYYGIPGDFSDDVYDTVTELEPVGGTIPEVIKAKPGPAGEPAEIPAEEHIEIPWEKPLEIPDEAPVDEPAAEEAEETEEIFQAGDEPAGGPDEELLADEEFIASMLYGKPEDKDAPEAAEIHDGLPQSGSAEMPAESKAVPLYMGRDYSYLPRKTVIYERIPLSKKMDIINRERVAGMFKEYLSEMKDPDRVILEGSVAEIKFGEKPPKKKAAAKKQAKKQPKKKPAAKKKAAPKKTAKKAAPKAAAAKATPKTAKAAETKAAKTIRNSEKTTKDNN